MVGVLRPPKWRAANMKVRLAAVTVLGLAAGGIVLFASSKGGAAQDSSFVRDGEAGFVVTQFAYSLGPDAKDTGACPAGMSKTVVDIFKATPEGAQRQGEGDEEYSKRLEAGGEALSMTPSGKNVCMYPELAPPDPHYRTLDAKTVRIDGINLDGKVSPADFMGSKGGQGIDNQMYRLVGCTHAFQSTGQANGIDMTASGWGILIRLKGVDDLRNDDSVEVGIYANADPMQTSPTREPLRYATYAMDQDRTFRATTKGRISNGTLITEPVDVAFHSIVNGIHMVRPLREARIHAAVSKDGRVKGHLAGFTPIEALYNYQYGYRNGKTASGEPSPLPLRLGSSNGAARVLGYTCPGVYHAMRRLADGHPDPKTGQFTSISTQYRIEAINAFVVDVETRSVNDTLIANKAGKST